jgi:beta-galactosidase
MEKPMLTALLFLCMHLSLFARTGPLSPAVGLFLPATPENPATPATSATLATPATPADTIAPNPIITTLVLPVPHTLITIRVYNNTRVRDFSNTILEWVLLVNGVARQKGTISQLIITPQHAALVRLPVKMPSGAGEEIFLQLRYRVRKKEPPTPAGATIADEQLLLKAWDGSNLAVSPVGELSFNDEDGLFTVHSAVLRARFDKQTGWLQQYEVRGFRLLEDPPGLKPDLWQPAADSSWQQPTRAPRLQLFSTSTGNGIVIVRTEYLIPETACHLHLSYTINAAGEMQVEQSMEADSSQIGWTLPRFGMQWTTPSGLDSITWYGHAAAVVGIYRQTTGQQPSMTTSDSSTAAPGSSTAAPGSSTASPDSSMGTGIRWWKITGMDGRGMLITADSSLLHISSRSAGNTGTRLTIGYLASPLPYELPYGNYHYAYKVTPVPAL